MDHWMDPEGKTDHHSNSSLGPSLPLRRNPESVDDFEHLESFKGDLSPSKESTLKAQDVLREDLADRKFETYPERDDIAEFTQLEPPTHDFGFDFPELKAFESSNVPKSEVSPKHDPLVGFLGGLGQSVPQHFAEPIRDVPTSAQTGKGIQDSMSFLQHESQHHHMPAAGDMFVDDPYSRSSPTEKEDYSLEDEVIRHKTPSPDLLPEPEKGELPVFNPPNESQEDSVEYFLSKGSTKPTPDNSRKPSSDQFREPSPEPIREPTPEPFREPSPLPVQKPPPPTVREPSPELISKQSPAFVRDPTPELVREPTPEPPKSTPLPSFFESDVVEKKPEKKEPEAKPMISKPTSPPPAPPKQLSSGGSKSCDGLAVWFNPQRMHPKVEALVYWRDPKKSGIVFGGVMVVLLSLTFYSFISVVANLSLLALAAAFGFRVYKTIQQAIQKTSDGHPFKEILELDLALPADKVRQTSDLAVTHVNAIVSELRRLFLVEDFIDSIKFGLILWMLTYLGSWFNGMTLIIVGVVALFTLPKVYETNKAQIDQQIELITGKVNEITAKVKAAIPIGKKAEEKKEQ